MRVNLSVHSGCRCTYLYEYYCYHFYFLCQGICEKPSQLTYTSFSPFLHIGLKMRSLISLRSSPRSQLAYCACILFFFLGGGAAIASGTTCLLQLHGVQHKECAMQLGCLFRCGAILCDSLMWTAPCPEGKTAPAPSQMEQGPHGAAPNQSPLLRSDVEAYCDTIVRGMKVPTAYPPPPPLPSTPTCF